KCKGCGRSLRPDPRNQGRQEYCSRRQCQRQRKTLRQRQRRQGAKPTLGLAAASQPGRGLQGASVISEADIRTENPVFVGLISMVTGLTDLEDIQRIYRQLWLRGKEILAAGEARALQNPAIISILEKAEDRSRQTG
ncbi:MAG: hypothetical protein LV473_23215, partial [Nitrospira sp.]|nr:hypothetical protein [Nitrospira sp.]